MERIAIYEKHEQDEDRIMSSVPHLEIFYETDLLNQQNYQATLNKICEFLGIEKSDCQSSNLVKANPDNIRDLVDNYTEIIEAIQNSKYSHYLKADD